MSDLAALKDWVAPLLAKLQPSEVRALARQIGTELRRSQAQRIAQQQAPDGSAYVPRKAQPAKRLRDARGSIRRGAMFKKLRTARHLKVQASEQEAAVGFLGRVARIARVHHEGLRDQVTPGGPEVVYPARELLGFSEADRERILDLVLQRLA